MPNGRLLLVILVLGCAVVGSSQEPPRLLFLAVQPKTFYEVADRKLTDELNRNLPPGRVSIAAPSRFSEYSDLITAVVRPNQHAFIARMTPYAYVAARMLGAPVDAIATYLRPDDAASGELRSTYRAYFVVRATQFNQSSPTLEDVYQFLKASARDKPARFTYGQQFSTSGFFVPALWMRSRHIFATDQDSGGIVRISSGLFNNHGSRMS